MKYTCINIQGNLISEEILQKVEQGTADGQTAKDFGLDPGSNLRNEIEYAWSRIKLDWKYFSEKSQHPPINDPYGTTLSRRWMEQFFPTLGFELQKAKTSLTGDNNQTYNISNIAANLDGLPVHLVGFFEPGNPDKNTLDIKTSGGTSRLSPHATVQEYLNVTEHLFGIAANGMSLRLIRDSGRLVKLTYLEFDIKRMLDEDKYSEFTLLYRLLHASRFPKTKAEADQCLLEKYYQDSIETGNRIRDGLSRAVKESLIALGKGFLQHEDNDALRQKIQTGRLTPKDLYRQLLRLIYRLLFLMVTEERDLVYSPDERNEDLTRKKRIYTQFYSIARLRKLSESRYVYEKQFSDLWQGLTNTFQLFEAGIKGKKLGIQPLDGDLFNDSAIRDIQTSLISNQLLLECIRNMDEFEDSNKNLVPINYRSLDVEELGSVYEGLLELHPVIENIDAPNPAHINFTFHGGTDRKTTGSYYTRPDLVNELIKSALIPVIEERLKQRIGDKEAQDRALLALKVCDAAAGSGHMLLAAARTIAWYLAKVRGGEDNPSPPLFRGCLREVIQHCIYGVDLNPDAVELCKLALWLEGHNSGKPLSFLDHKIRNGNSLVGVTDLAVLAKGIPDDAYYPVTGDDKEVGKELKKANAAFNKTRQISLFDQQATKAETHAFSETYHELEEIRQDDVEAVHQVQVKFEQLRSNVRWWKDWRACNLWTAAFFFEFKDENKQTVPTSERLQKFLQNPEAAYGPMIGKANALAEETKFFHWPLEFPDVFEQGGFDVMLGNPPWEKINLEDLEFFATRDTEISSITKSSPRTKAINQLQVTNPALFNEYRTVLAKTNKAINYFRSKAIYQYGNEGLLNTYPLFTELVVKSINVKGKAGLVLPSGFFGDDTISPLFRYCVKNDFVDTVFDFENSKKIFPDVHRQTRFSLVTLSKLKKKEIGFKAKFFLTDPFDIKNEKANSLLTFDYEILKKFNPNNLVCPSFKSRFEYDLNIKLFNFGVFKAADDQSSNDVDVHRMINMSSDSDLLINSYFDEGLPLYESKLIFQYDHRYSTFENVPIEEKNKGNALDVSVSQKANPYFKIEPRYFCHKDIIIEKNTKWKWPHSWYLIYRVISASTNERTSIASVIPTSAVSYSAYIIFVYDVFEAVFQMSFMNTLVFDFVARSKVNINFPPVILFQTPRIKKKNISVESQLYIIVRSLELAYSSWDIKCFANDIWRESDDTLKAAIQQQWEENKIETGSYEWLPPERSEIDKNDFPLPPFKWDEERRAVLKAELDAIYAKLYGLTTEELRYILDPQDVYGPDFPGETFRVLKEREIRLYGEYRTRRLVLEAWEKLK